MLTLERQNQILEILKRDKSVSIAKLAKTFFIGEATIRRDLDKLEKQRLIQRTYGGAVLIEGLNTEIPIAVREKEQSAAKDCIGQLAASFVKDGDIIIMDSSTSTHAMIPHLRSKKELTVITNGLSTAADLGNTLHNAVYCTGGKLRENSSSLVGQNASEYLRAFSVQKLFFSCRAIAADNGAMDGSEEEALLRRTMMENAEEVFLLCDSSKIGRRAFYKICDFSRLDYFITDRKPPEDILKVFASVNVQVICPENPVTN